MFSFIEIVRTFATCLITNSHFSPIYTHDIFAKGGAFGNSLFFLATGFCLAECGKNSFPAWYKKRLVRLYVPVFFASWFYLYIGNHWWDTVIFSFIFPQNYWFVCALVILYPLYYIAVKYPFRNRKYVYTAILILLYAVVYVQLDTSRYMVETIEFFAIRFSYIFSFFLMLLGAYLRKHFQEIKERFYKKRILILILFFGSMIAYFAFILLMKRFDILCRIQFVETILCILTSVSLFLFIMVYEDRMKSRSGYLNDITSFLGNHTLEIYLVQFPIINLVGRLQLMSIVKFVIAVFVILMSAFVLKKVSNCVIIAEMK